MVEFVHFGDSAGKVLHGLAGGATFEGFVATVQPANKSTPTETVVCCRLLSGWFGGLLGVGLLQQRAPKLVAVVRLQEDEFAVPGRQPVVDDDVHPRAVAPEPAPEEALDVVYH